MKGQFCWLEENKFCQEDSCPDCEIYHRTIKELTDDVMKMLEEKNGQGRAETRQNS